MKYLKKYNLENNEVDSLDLFDVLSNEPAIRELLNKGANINIQNRLGRTPLMNAIKYDSKSKTSFDIVKFLVENGADLDMTSIIGQTALFRAAMFNFKKIILYLIESGADWNIQNIDGEYFIDFLDEKFKEKLKNKYPDKYNDLMIRISARQYNL